MNAFQGRKINREENLAKNKVLKKPCWRFSQFHWLFRTHLALRDLWDTLRDSKTECKSWASRKYIPVFLIYFPLCANISFLEETLAQEQDSSGQISTWLKLQKSVREELLWQWIKVNGANRLSNVSKFTKHTKLWSILKRFRTRTYKAFDFK